MCDDFNKFLLKLPDVCKKFIAEDCMVFHLPHKHHDCPACGSQHTYVDRYRKQTLTGIPDTKLTYIYKTDGIAVKNVERRFLRTGTLSTPISECPGV